MYTEEEATIFKLRAAPAPDDQAKPRWPWQLSASSWRYVLRRSWSEFWHHHLLDHAGNLAYMSMQSLFPALLAVITVLTMIGQGPAAVQWMMELLETVAPEPIVDLMREPLNNLVHLRDLEVVLSIAVAGALWGASGYIGAFGRSSNHIYQVVEGRPVWQVIPYYLLLTVTLVIFGVLIMLSVLLSAGVWDMLLALVDVDDAWLRELRQARWPVLVVTAFGLILVLYRATPNVQQPRMRWTLPGALLAMVLLVLAIWGLSAWVRAFGMLPAMYGVVGSVIILLLGLWVMNIVLLIGVLLNAEIERARLLQAGFAAELELLVRPRSTRMIEARASEEGMLARWGAALRAEHAYDDD